MHGNTEICYIKIFPKQNLIWSISFQGRSRDDQWIEKAENWQTGWLPEGNYLHFKKKEKNDQIQGATGHVGQGLSDHDNNVKASFFRTFFQKWAYFAGVEFTIVQYHKWSTTANGPQNGPEMILDR